ncbi:MAG: hypothetical protein PHV49_03405 [Alistipes sp.]|nr:hypothetical protein [Alistipes sp.]
MKNRVTRWGIGLWGCALLLGATGCQKQIPESPCIVNIINFVRQTEPRPVNISDEDLYQTTAEQVALLKKYNLRGSFLLQYDALINPKYQALMQEAMQAGSEIGGWWEITQPHVEAAGLTWRGIYPWDWHANVGFSSGYTPQEREKLVDTYMAKFKEIFGHYPTAVGSWFIDAHTLQYMTEKYQIEASCNCRDQVGTDGYTLWGGYWNQAYYPSKQNAYMPAQSAQSQINVPVFRMLGSDPINQYDSGLGHPAQGVETLEPVYGGGGGDPTWVKWFFGMLTEGPHLAFQYTQVGQENSFTWPRMKQGLECQIPLVDSLSRSGKVTVLTLSEAGKWFKSKFEQTPATSVVALHDVRAAGRQSVWYNSRFYRANMMWSDSTLRFRDIHLFDERLASRYLTEPGTSTQCFYTTLPVVDGFNWSSETEVAGLRLICQDTAGLHVVAVGSPVVREEADGVLSVVTPILSGDSCKIRMEEGTLRMQLPVRAQGKYGWALNVASGKTLPFTTLSTDAVQAQVDGFDYRMNCSQGAIQAMDSTTVLCLMPDAQGELVLDMAVR